MYGVALGSKSHQGADVFITLQGFRRSSAAERNEALEDHLHPDSAEHDVLSITGLHSSVWRVWWWFVPPGFAIMSIVGALYVTNVGLDEVFNPKLREM